MIIIKSQDGKTIKKLDSVWVNKILYLKIQNQINSLSTYGNPNKIMIEKIKADKNNYYWTISNLGRYKKEDVTMKVFKEIEYHIENGNVNNIYSMPSDKSE